MAPPGQTYAPAQAPTNGFAVTSMVLGIVAFPMFFMGIVLAPLALIFGGVAVGQIKKKGQRGMGMAIAGLVLAGIWLIGAFFVFSLIMGEF
jgi:hypothetical protein